MGNKETQGIVKSKEDNNYYLAAIETINNKPFVREVWPPSKSSSTNELCKKDLDGMFERMQYDLTETAQFLHETDQDAYEYVGDPSKTCALNESKSTPESLFPEWKRRELEVDNDEANVKSYKELKGDSKDVFNEYVKLVNKFPKINKNDLHAAVSVITIVGEEYDGHEWESLSEEDFNKIRDFLEN